MLQINQTQIIQIRTSNVFLRLDGDIHHPNHHYCSSRTERNPYSYKFIKSITQNLRKVSREFSSTVDEITHIQEVKDIKKEILDTKEAVLKEGKELDEFIEKNNEEIMKKKMTVDTEDTSMNFLDHLKELRQKLIYSIIFF